MFYCGLDHLNEKYPQPVDRRHLIKLDSGQEVASYNLVLSSLCQGKRPRNPFTGVELTDSELKKLSEECGISLAAFKEIWDMDLERVVEKINKNRDETRKISIETAKALRDQGNQELTGLTCKERFVNLHELLSNQLTPASSHTARQKRDALLSKLREMDAWRCQF